MFMQYRKLGSTGIQVSAIAFGAGPVPALLTGDNADPDAVVGRAIDAGINWFDTAATYGDGRSESQLGAALDRLGAKQRVHIATKVRLFPEQMDDVRGAVRMSVEGSLRRLGVERLTLLQLHNAVTTLRGDEPTSLSADDVLSPGGVADAMQQLRDEGLVEHLGLTGIGHAAALGDVIASARFATVQTPYNLANPTAGQPAPSGFCEADYGHLVAKCSDQQMGVFAIRVFAAGALTGQRPSAHTHKTAFFPLDLYRRDMARGERMAALLDGGVDMPEACLRFALAHQQFSAAIIGFSTVEQVDHAARCAEAGPLSGETIRRLLSVL